MCRSQLTLLVLLVIFLHLAPLAQPGVPCAQPPLPIVALWLARTHVPRMRHFASNQCLQKVEFGLSQNRHAQLLGVLPGDLCLPLLQAGQLMPVGGLVGAKECSTMTPRYHEWSRELLAGRIHSLMHDVQECGRVRLPSGVPGRQLLTDASSGHLAPGAEQGLSTIRILLAEHLLRLSQRDLWLRCLFGLLQLFHEYQVLTLLNLSRGSLNRRRHLVPPRRIALRVLVEHAEAEQGEHDPCHCVAPPLLLRGGRLILDTIQRRLVHCLPVR
mmetsp:Transcript_114841/g.288663  ORF Transcript_114841/g.288663 Transcript_114841/m.288663 type:complete len:271 (-) Transcript_114841:7-819(-)